MAQKKLRVILIGSRANGHGGVVLDVIREHKLHTVVGFLDDAAVAKKVLGIPVLGKIEEFLRKPTAKADAYFVCSGDNGFRERTYHLLKGRGLKLANVIHPSAVISKSARLGEGVFVGANVVMTHNVAVGNAVLINTAATLDHDNVVEDFVNISPGCHLSGRVTIKRGAFLGTGVSAIPDVVVHEYAVVGSGAVVIRDVPSRATFVGVPARRMGQK
jgi:sugar O-acyltransferase (sialic acid O-acetyltransferase NeuD family)